MRRKKTEKFVKDLERDSGKTQGDPRDVAPQENTRDETSKPSIPSRKNTDRSSIAVLAAETQSTLIRQTIDDMYMDLDKLEKVLAILFPDIKCRVRVKLGVYYIDVPRFLTEVSSRFMRIWAKADAPAGRTTFC